jgi:hypothetical protein
MLQLLQLMELDNVPVIVQPGQAVGTIGLALGLVVSGFEREMK